MSEPLFRYRFTGAGAGPEATIRLKSSLRKWPCNWGAVLKRDVLVRVRRTKTQTKKSVAEKTANVAGAFKVRNVAGLERVSHILLVDDVFTTGATLYSCYMAIKEGVGSGVRISIATLACVGR